MYTHTNTLRQTEIENQRQRYTYAHILARVCIHIYTLVFLDKFTCTQPIADWVAKNFEIISQFCQRTIILPMGFTIRTG